MHARFSGLFGLLLCAPLGACLPEENNARIGVGEANTGSRIGVGEANTGGRTEVTEDPLSATGGAMMDSGSEDMMELGSALPVLTVREAGALSFLIVRTSQRGALRTTFAEVGGEVWRSECPLHHECRYGIARETYAELTPLPEDEYYFDDWDGDGCIPSLWPCDLYMNFEIEPGPVFISPIFEVKF